MTRIFLNIYQGAGVTFFYYIKLSTAIVMCKCENMLSVCGGILIEIQIQMKVSIQIQLHIHIHIQL